MEKQFAHAQKDMYICDRLWRVIIKPIGENQQRNPEKRKTITATIITSANSRLWLNPRGNILLHQIISIKTTIILQEQQQ